MKEGGNLRGIEKSRLKRLKRTAQVIESLSIPRGGGFSTVLGVAGPDGCVDGAGMAVTARLGREGPTWVQHPKIPGQSLSSNDTLPCQHPTAVHFSPPNSLGTPFTESSVAPPFSGWSCSFQSQSPSHQQHRLAS